MDVDQTLQAWARGD